MTGCTDEASPPSPQLPTHVSLVSFPSAAPELFPRQAASEASFSTLPSSLTDWWCAAGLYLGSHNAFYCLCAGVCACTPPQVHTLAFAPSPVPLSPAASNSCQLPAAEVMGSGTRTGLLRTVLFKLTLGPPTSSHFQVGRCSPVWSDSEMYSILGTAPARPLHQHISRPRRDRPWLGGPAHTPARCLTPQG